MASMPVRSIRVVSFTHSIAVALVAGIVAFTTSTANAQLRTEFDGRARPSRIPLRCEIIFEERDIKLARSDARGSLVSVMEQVGDWISHGYAEVQSRSEGNRIIKSYARTFKVRVRVEAAILNIDTRPFPRHANVVYQWQQPRYDIDTLPSAMESYASGETKGRIQQRSSAIIQRLGKELHAIQQKLNELGFQYNSSELDLIRRTRQGGFARNANIRFCGNTHTVNFDVRWRSYVPGSIGGEGRP